MQQYARQHRLPLDVMRFLVEVTDRRPPLPGEAVPAGAPALEPAPDGGVYVNGLTLEGEGDRFTPAGLACERCAARSAGCSRSVVGLPAGATPAPPPPGVHVDLLHATRPRSIAGARWDAEDGCLRESLPGCLRQPLPALLIKPVTAERHAAALAAGDLYTCPVYTNGMRANVRGRGKVWEEPTTSPVGPTVHAPGLALAWATLGFCCRVDAQGFHSVFLPLVQVYSPLIAQFTLRTREPPSKWVLASVALLLQDETAA